MRLCEAVDLHVAVQTIPCLVVYSDTQSGIAHQRIESGELFRELLCHLVCLLKILEIALPPLDFACITKLFQRLLCFVGMLFLIRKEVYLLRVVLENVRDDAVANASRTSRYDVDLSIDQQS
jgi:hypothetical protein